mgnify:CR=1 FL=1
MSISIHSLPKEGDVITQWIITQANVFQSTPSPKRETICIYSQLFNGVISIHSLPKEGD